MIESSFHLPPTCPSLCLLFRLNLTMKTNLNFCSSFFFFHFISSICKMFLTIFRPLSKNIKSSQHLSDSVPQYFRGGRGGAPSNKTSSYSPSNNMEFLRGVYAFMQVSRSSVSFNFFPITNHTNLFNTINDTVSNIKHINRNTIYYPCHIYNYNFCIKVSFKSTHNPYLINVIKQGNFSTKWTLILA